MAVAACVLLILWLSLRSVPVQLINSHGWGKVYHAVAYGGLTLVVGWAFAALPRLKERRWFFAVLIAVVWGGVMELLQYLLTTTRHARFSDILADFAGALVAWYVVKLAGNRGGKS